MLISRSYLSGVAAAALFIGLSVAPSLAKERESFEQTISRGLKSSSKVDG
jgi:hypothetical protein